MEMEAIRPELVAAVRTVYDPEIPVNVYDFGLVYGMREDGRGGVDVEMTLTSPSCPEAELIPVRVQEALEAVPGVDRARVEVVWDPPWTPERMSDAAKLELGMF